MDKPLVLQILRGVWVFFIITLIILALLYITPLVYPFIIGWAIAYMLNPLVQLLQRKTKFPRWLAVTASLFIFLATATLFITLIITRIVSEISKLVKFINANIDDWIKAVVNLVNSDYMQNIISQINIFYNENVNYQSTINDNVSNAGQRIAKAATDLFGSIVNGSINIIAALPTFALVLVVVLLAAFFISKDWHKLIVRISALFPENIKASSREVWSDLQKALFGYIRAQLILISITALFITMGLLLLHVNYAVTIGLLIGLVDLMPYLGTGTVMVPWAIYVFTTGNIPLGIGLSILYGIVLVVRQIIEPKIVAKSIGLNALSTLIAMFVGLKLLGVLGLILGPITLIIISSFFRAHVFRDIRHYIMYGKKAV